MDVLYHMLCFYTVTSFRKLYKHFVFRYWVCASFIDAMPSYSLLLLGFVNATAGFFASPSHRRDER